jgi:translation initiation factor IF-2
MRVFELAKQLGVPSKDLMKDLKNLGVTVATHMAVLEDETVAKILAKAAPKAKKQAGPSAVKALKATAKAKAAKPAPTPVLKSKGASARATAPAKPAPPLAEPPKAEKKLILVKRRSSETSTV